MATFEVRASLTQQSFPFYHKELSSTVMVSQNNAELNRIPIRNFDGENSETSYGIPQAYYMENVMPHTRGYTTIAFSETIRPHDYEEEWLLANFYDWLRANGDPDSYLLANDNLVGTTPGYVNDLYVVRETNATIDQVILYSPAYGADIIYSPNFGGWNRFDSNPDFEGMVTVAQVQGKHYIFYENVGCYQYDFNANTFNEVTLTGLDKFQIRGICSGGLRLVAWDNITTYWSSAGAGGATDFTPSLITGAGSTNIIGARSPITIIYPLAEGFVAYTETNAVAAQFTGNEIVPWAFSEIPGSAGILDSNHVTFDSNYDFHLAWTTSGFQKVQFRQADLVWPELSDSLSRGLISVRSNQTGEIKQESFNLLDVKLNSVGARYTCVSVRELTGKPTSQYEHCYVYDWSNSRWGRLRVPHSDFLDLRIPTLEIPTLYSDLITSGVTYNELIVNKIKYTDWDPQQIAQGLGDSFGVVSSSGVIFNCVQYLDVDSNLDDETDNPSRATEPCLYLGRYKLVRGKGITLQEVQIDSDFVGTLNAYSIDTSGDVADQIAVADTQFDGVASRYSTILNGDSIAVSLHGKFNLSNLVLSCNSTGGRSPVRKGSF